MFERMKTVSIRPIALLIALTAAGCGDGSPTPTESAAAKLHLTEALDVWKSGGSKAILAEKSPSFLVLDRDWDKGEKLTEYAIEGEGQPLGAGVQWPVTLTLKNEKGKVTKKKVTYAVNVGDVISIARQDVDF